MGETIIGSHYNRDKYEGPKTFSIVRGGVPISHAGITCSIVL